jgi:uncharacterized protein (DUF2236 family)
MNAAQFAADRVRRRAPCGRARLDRARRADDDGPVLAVSRADLEASLAEVRARVADPRHGVFGPGSVVWRLGGDLDVFLGGGRAALLQLAHPKVAYAIDQHSRTRADVGGRFQRTFAHVFAMVFGDLDEACTSARRVHAVHSRVHGTISDAIGSWRAGTPYEANDPETLRWVQATLLDTVLVVRERLRGALPEHVKDAFVREHDRFAALFAIPPALRARTHAEHAAYMARMLASGELAVAPCARDMARFLVGRGGDAMQPPLGRAVEALSAELLPGDLARAFELRGSRRWARVALHALAPVARIAPDAALAIPARAQAERRIARRPASRVAAWTERRLFGLAKKSTRPGG